jgi:NAD(P)H-hydrate repair Nnr-like enzyme with NAD(P)H-hydrate epimerase domain
MKLVTVAQMQKIEKDADAGGLTYDQMMENAGQGLADIVLDLFLDEADVLREASALLLQPGVSEWIRA